MKHSLKIEEQYLDNLIDGKKKVEIRVNDRDYQVGDTLDFSGSAELYGYDEFRFKKCLFRVTHIHSGMGMEKGWVAMSVESYA